MKIPLILAAATACAAGAALAQTPPVGTPSTPPTSGTGSQATSSSYTRLDTDLDGMLTKKEASSNAALGKRWDTLDVNKDGQLDSSEFARFEAESAIAPGGAAGSVGASTGTEKDTKPRSSDKPQP